VKRTIKSSLFPFLVNNTLILIWEIQDRTREDEESLDEMMEWGSNQQKMARQKMAWQKII
jgi:hypothetical protein